jgi:2-dehydropantoate 2-reductase
VRVAIVGAGAMGCVFGAAIAAAGNETTLIDVDPIVVGAITAAGVGVRRDGDERHVPVAATVDPATIGDVDVLIVFVKGFHTRAAAGAAAVCVTPATILVTLQNGLGNGEILAEIFPPDQVVVGVTAESGTTLAPGRVDHPGRAATSVGPFRGTNLERPERVAALLRRAGFDAAATPAIETAMWKKLIVGAATLPAPAIANMTCGPLVAHPEMSALMDETARETVAVARGLGHDIDVDERIAYIRKLLLMVPDAKGSMVQDMAAGRRTEIDTINGAVVRAADTVGVDVPVNRTLVALVKGWESVRGLA